jgi:hypothetical protein
MHLATPIWNRGERQDAPVAKQASGGSRYCTAVPPAAQVGSDVTVATSQSGSYGLVQMCPKALNILFKGSEPQVGALRVPVTAPDDPPILPYCDQVAGLDTLDGSEEACLAGSG